LFDSQIEITPSRGKLKRLEIEICVQVNGHQKVLREVLAGVDAVCRNKSGYDLGVKITRRFDIEIEDGQ